MIWQIFTRFFVLGWVSFGGPAAHIGYFRRTFVSELNWLDDRHYASIVALSQFLPGPSSSQIGFAIGYHRGRITGAIAAFLGFTLPSFLLLYLMAVTSSIWLESSLFQGAVHGLKLLAVVVVADAVTAMFQQFCQRAEARGIMLGAAVVILLWPVMAVQLFILIGGALLGWWLLGDRMGRGVHVARNVAAEPMYETSYDTSEGVSASVPVRWGYVLIFTLLLLFALTTAYSDSFAGLFGQFYQTGALVFGGGHVVLPLLQTAVAGELSADRFMLGYALAQAVPGPMFTLATFLGAEMWLSYPLLGAIVATLAIFLPGFLLLLAFMQAWHSLAQRPNIAAIVAGINAAVVGLLLAALYQPVFLSGVLTATDMALVLLGFGLLKLRRVHIVLLVAGFAVVGMILVGL